MLRDIEYFESRLGKIDGFEDVGEYLANIVKSKVISSAASPPAGTSAAAADKPEEKQPSEGSTETPSAADTNNGTEKVSEELAAQAGEVQKG